MEKAKNTLIRTFGRTRGKKLSPRQNRLIMEQLPKILPTCDGIGDGGILEIGFGAGEHIIDLADTHPDKTIIGCEPFINGVASLLSHIADDTEKIRPEYQNIRIWADDVRKFITMIPTQYTFSEIWILHPDPWPKARHEKRRLLSSDFLKTLGPLISKDGTIIIGTDHTDYYTWIIDQIYQTGLEVKSREMPIIKTRYNEKDLFGSGKTRYLILGHAEPTHNK